MSKKLVIKDVKFGKVPYGPGMGTSSVAVYFDEVEGKYEYPTPEAEGKTFTEEETVAHGLMMDLLDKLREVKLENKWSEVMLARNYVYFVGNCLASPENRRFSAAFLETIDKCALDIQVKIIKERVPEAKMSSEIMKKLQAPLTCFVCEPTYFTGKDDFYQRFRLILTKYPLNKKPVFNQMACVEIGNHNFATTVLDITDFKNEESVIKEAYESIGAFTVPEDRIFVIDHKGDINVAKFAVEKGYRLNRAMEYEGICLDF